MARESSPLYPSSESTRVVYSLYSRPIFSYVLLTESAPIKLSQDASDGWPAGPDGPRYASLRCTAKHFLPLVNFAPPQWGAALFFSDLPRFSLKIRGPRASLLTRSSLIIHEPRRGLMADLPVLHCARHTCDAALCARSGPDPHPALFEPRTPFLSRTLAAACLR